jgi:transposase
MWDFTSQSKTLEFLDDNNVELQGWRPYLPDLNIIENIRAYIKNDYFSLYSRDLNLNCLKGER